MRVVFHATLMLLGAWAGACGRQDAPRSADLGGPIQERQEFANAPGWAWVGSTTEFHPGRKWGTAQDKILVTGHSVVEADTGMLRIFAAWAMPRRVKNDAPHRLVLIDADGKRHLPKAHDVGGMSNADITQRSGLYSIDPDLLGVDRVGHVGIEYYVGRGRAEP